MGDLELLNSVVDISHWVETPISLHAAAEQASSSLSCKSNTCSLRVHLLHLISINVLEASRCTIVKPAEFQALWIISIYIGSTHSSCC